MKSKTNKYGISHAIQRQQNIVSYIFLAPMFVFFIGFVLLPMAMGIVTSLFNYTMNDFSFIGLKNYAELIKDAVFQRALWNTFIIVIGSVPLVAIFSLWVASVIFDKPSGITSFFRGVFYSSFPDRFMWQSSPTIPRSASPDRSGRQSCRF